SAQENSGIELLFQAIQERLRSNLVCENLLLPVTAGAIYAQFKAENCIKTEHFNEFGERIISIEINEVQWNKWVKQFPDLAEYIELAKWG
ncbi:TPA: GTPase HflX, partial [Mannheimia haemolytica]|nr:GTPase HflX [Mannheimia haemolytica]